MPARKTNNTMSESDVEPEVQPEVRPTVAPTTPAIETSAENTQAYAPEPHRINRQYFQKVGNKQHLTWPGLLDLAHHYTLDDGTPNPVKSIRTSILQYPEESNKNTVVVYAEVIMTDGSLFTGIGDANSDNVGKMVSAHLFRMAETRAKGRALRDAVNVGEATEEEFSTPAQSAAPRQFTPVVRNPTQEAIDELWRGADEDRKVRVRQFIADHLIEEFGEKAPTIRSLADVKTLPEAYLKRALEA